MLPAVPTILASLVGLAWWRRKKNGEKKLKSSHKMTYENAMNLEKNPEKLELLADAFESEGHTAEAKLLRKRAGLHRLSPETKAGRKEAYRKAMNSLDPDAVMRMANAYTQQGCTGAAASLIAYANGLKNANKAASQKPADSQPDVIPAKEG